MFSCERILGASFASTRVSDHSREKIWKSGAAIGLLRAALLLVTPVLFCGTLLAQQVTLTDDATFPKLIGSLTVQGSAAPSGEAVSFVKFNLSSNLPASTTASAIAKATLTLYAAQVNTSGSFNVYPITAPWSEADPLTPTYDLAHPVATGLQISAADSFVTIDLTNLVKQWLTSDGTLGQPNYGVALVANTPTTSVMFDSKESIATSHPAQLSLVLGAVPVADSAANFTNPLNGDVTGPQTSTVVTSVGGRSAVEIANATLAANAATSANNPGTIVKRDGSGNLSAGTVTAALDGNAATATLAQKATSADVASSFVRAANDEEIVTPTDGQIYYNTTTNVFRIFSSTPPTWKTIDAGSIADMSTIPISGNQVSGELTNATIPATAINGNIPAGQINGSLLQATIPGSSITGPIDALQVSGEVALATVAKSASAISPTATVPGSQVNGDIPGRAASITGTLNGDQVSGPLTNATIDGSKITGTLAIQQNALNVGTDQLIVAGGNVGIGTATPTQKLDVKGNIGISSDGVIFRGTESFIHSFAAPGSRGENLFVGINSGNFTLAPNGGPPELASFNTSIGPGSGRSLVTGSENTFLGTQAGEYTTTGGHNVFLGDIAGNRNTIGMRNTYVGQAAGFAALSGQDNAFLGYAAGYSITTGSRNTFFGFEAARGYQLGTDGNAPVTDTNGILIGYGTNRSVPSSVQLDNYIGLGSGTLIDKSNQAKLGNSQITETLLFGNVGMGTTSPAERLEVNGNVKMIGAGNGLIFPNGSVQTTAATTVDAILNQTGEQAGANFNISGNGTIAGTLNAGSVNAVTITGDGAGLTNLNATNITTGTLNNARLGVVPIANGGTGTNSSPNTAGLFLRSVAANQWGVGTLQLTDIPDLAGSYIKNTTVQQSQSNFNISGNGILGGGLNLDQGNTNNGTLAEPGLSFGFQSGEGIASKRTAGGNQNGLDFITNLTPRLSITRLGAVGIGTTNPTATLDVNGNTNITGQFAVNGDMTVANTAPDDTTASTTAITIQNRGASATTYAWKILTSAVGGGLTVTPNAFEIWEHGNGGCVAGGWCGARFRILPSSNGTSAPPIVVDGSGNLTMGGRINANGSELTNLDASKISSGTLDNNRLGIVSADKGGTGLNAAGATGNVLLSNGTTWSSARLSASDLPNLGASYVQNSTTLQANSNFNISGNGIIGTDLTVGGRINGNGSGLTELNAGTITSGTISNARLGLIPITNGGTGLSASGLSGNFLRSNGTTWTSSPLLAADLPAGSQNYVQSNPATQQASVSLNIGGAGTFGGNVNVGGRLDVTGLVNATDRYAQNGNQILKAVDNGATRGGNLYLGFGSGQNTVPGSSNGTAGTSDTFLGAGAGSLNTSGAANTFAGSFSGQRNTTGDNNSFFGAIAGQENTTGAGNSFFGYSAGLHNSGGQANTFMGLNTGLLNAGGSNNAFFGAQAGRNNSDGGNNTFVGSLAGQANETGSNNTVIGASANVGANNLVNATAIGAGATVSQSNSLVLGNNGSIVDGAPATNVGIGTSTPQSALQVNGYVQLALTSGPPPAADCDQTSKAGRMKVDAVNSKLYVCTNTGWKSVTLAP